MCVYYDFIYIKCVFILYMCLFIFYGIILVLMNSNDSINVRVMKVNFVYGNG